MLWERLLGDKSLSDVATLNETMSLTWYSSQELNQSIQLPGSLQSLTFGFDFNQSLEGIQLPTSLQTSATRQPAQFDLRRQLRPELGGHPTAQQPAEFDAWRKVQPELGGHPTTRQPAEFDVRRQPRVQGSRLRVYQDPPKCPLGYLGSLLKGSLKGSYKGSFRV